MNNLIRGPDNIRDLARVKAVFFDFDGVFTDNCEYYIPGVGTAKKRNYYCGQGVSHLRAIGVRVVVITGEKDQSAELVTKLVQKWNTLPSSKSDKKPDGWEHVTLFTGCRGEQKAEKLSGWLGEIGVSPEDTFGVGDDVADYPALMLCGLRGCPCTGEEVIQNISHFISKRPGGNGAVRDFTNQILWVKGINPLTLPVA